MARLWQVLMTIVIVAGVGLAIDDAVFKLLRPAGYDGIASVAITSAPVPMAGRLAYHVNAVDAGSPAERAGIRAGDIIVPTTGVYADPAVVGATSQVYLLRPGEVPHPVTMVMAPRWLTPTEAAQTFVFGLVRLVCLAVALLLVVRRPRDTVARALVLFLLGIGLLNGSFRSPFPVSAIGGVLQHVGFAASLIGLVVFCNAFPAYPRDGRRRTVFVAGLAVACAAAAIFLANGLSTTVLLSAFWLHGLPGALFYAGIVGAYAAALAGLVLGFRESESVERQRLQWILLSFAIGLSGLAGEITIELFGLVNAHAFQGYLLATQIAIPLGLGYAMLRYRLLDLGFVLNRTAVYAALTAIVVPLFAAAEWAVDKFVSAQYRTASLLLEFAAAMAIVVLFRWLHGRVEALVDRVLFARRHHDEEALRAFGRQAHFVLSRDALVNRCAETIQRHAGASGVGVFLRYGGDSFMRAAQRGDNRFAAVLAPDDPALVAARASLQPSVALDGALADARVFPLVVRGELTGLIACAPKSSGEAYAPDERQTLAELATSVGLALDGLRLRDLEANVADLSVRAAEAEALRSRADFAERQLAVLQDVLARNGVQP